MWKVLLVISAVVLGGAGYLAWDNKGSLESKKDELTVAKQTLETRQNSLEETKQEVAALEQSIMMLNDEAEQLQTEKIDLDAKLVDAQANLKQLESRRGDAETELTKAKEMIKEFSDIEAIQRELVQIRTQTEEAEIEVAQLEGAVAAAKVEKERLTKVADELGALRQDQAAGVIRGEFQSSIKRAFNQWGFVVVNGGNDQGVVENAQLDVYRRGQPICKLLVTSVEPSESAADIIPGSLVPGQTVQEGDMVIKSVQARAVARPGGEAAPAGQPAATGAPATPATPAAGGGMGGGEADPFGGGGGMDSSSEPDPFGGGGGSMESESEPDPFQ